MFKRCKICNFKEQYPSEYEDIMIGIRVFHKTGKGSYGKISDQFNNDTGEKTNRNNIHNHIGHDEQYNDDPQQRIVILKKKPKPPKKAKKPKPQKKEKPPVEITEEERNFGKLYVIDFNLKESAKMAFKDHTDPVRYAKTVMKKQSFHEYMEGLVEADNIKSKKLVVNGEMTEIEADYRSRTLDDVIYYAWDLLHKTIAEVPILEKDGTPTGQVRIFQPQTALGSLKTLKDCLSVAGKIYGPQESKAVKEILNRVKEKEIDPAMAMIEIDLIDAPMPKSLITLVSLYKDNPPLRTPLPTDLKDITPENYTIEEMEEMEDEIKRRMATRIENQYKQ